jgi:hypothetical protein
MDELFKGRHFEREIIVLRGWPLTRYSHPLEKRFPRRLNRRRMRCEQRAFVS